MELVAGVVLVAVFVVVVVVRGGVAGDAVAFPCTPITAAIRAAAAAEAAATARVTRLTRRLPAARTFVFARSIAMST